MKVFKPILPSRVNRAIHEVVRRELLHWFEGYATYLAPGPPILIAEQPTYAPMRVYAQHGDPPVRIGRYCSINVTVTLMAGSEHPLDAVTTFHSTGG